MWPGSDSCPALAVLFLSASQDSFAPGAHAPIPGYGFPDGPHLSGTSSKKQGKKNRAVFPPAYSLVGSGGFKNPKSLEKPDRGLAAPGE